MPAWTSPPCWEMHPGETGCPALISCKVRGEPHVAPLGPLCSRKVL